MCIRDSGNVQVADVIGVSGIATALSTGLVTVAAGASTTVTGSQLDFATGIVNVADVVGVTGNRVNLNTGTVATTGAANILPTGSQTNLQLDLLHLNLYILLQDQV